MKIVKPMLLSYQEEITSEEEWLYEPKYDGIRLLVGENYSYTRHGTITTNRFPELQFSGIDALLDGELIAPGSSSPDNFEGSMSRFSGNKEQPIIFMAFDLLTYKNSSVTSYPIEERKGLLTEVITNIDSPFIHLVPYIHKEGIAFFNVIKENNMEGIVAKRSGSLYTPAKRSDNWRKIINWRYAELIVYKVSHSPLTVYLKNGEGEYVGSVRIGFTKEIRAQLYKKAVPYLCKVKFRGWTSKKKLRLPQLISLN